MPMDWNHPPRSGGSGRPDPDLSKVLEDVRSRLPNFKKIRGLWVILLVVAALALGSTCYYTVGPEETGVVLRFGRFVREAGPGLHFKMPLGIEQVINVKTGRVFKEEFGFRTVRPGVRSSFTEKGFQDESIMLTGDLNVIDVKWIVQYMISHPRQWLFDVQDGVGVLRDLSESVMRRIVGNRFSDAVLTMQRVEIAALAQTELQEVLNTYHTGVKVVTVKLQDVNPPLPVQPAFNEVNEARQQKERMINEAQEAYNHEIPKAKGDAERIITEAEGYATEVVNRAQGEAKRFTEVLAAYRQSTDVTKRRFYLEAMQKMINNAGRVYVMDEKTGGILPHINLRGGSAGAKEAGK